MKIVDCFPFFNEFTLLDARLAELGDIVDKFVVIESTETFTGKEKPLYLSECIKTRYAKYVDKIDVIVAPKFVPDSSNVPSDVPVSKIQWYREFFQKNHISKEGLSYLNLADDDVIIYGDADEITRNSVVRDIKDGKLTGDEGKFSGPTYYYKLNLMLAWARLDYDEPELSHKSGWISYKNLTNFSEEREKRRDLLPNSMWHFSYLMTPEAIKTKMESFSHQEFKHLIDIDHICKAVSNNQDVLGRPQSKFIVVDIDDTFPQYVKENKEMLKEWIAVL